MCSERVTGKSLCKRPFKWTHFTQEIQQQVTHALPGSGHKVAAAHSHTGGRPPGLFAKIGTVGFDHQKPLAFFLKAFWTSNFEQ